MRKKLISMLLCLSMLLSLSSVSAAAAAPKYDFILGFGDENCSPFRIGDVNKTVTNDWGDKSTILEPGKYGLMDQNGRVILPASYDNISGFDNGAAVCQKNGKAGLLSPSGKPLTTLKFDAISTFDGVKQAEYMYKGKYGIIGSNGRLVTGPRYDYIGDLWYYGEKHPKLHQSAFAADGYAQFIKGGKMGIISKYGKEIIPAKYDYVGRFSENYAVFRENDKCGLLNKSGRKVLPAKYDLLGPVSNGVMIYGVVYKPACEYHNTIYRYGILNTEGKILAEAKYDYISGEEYQRSVYNTEAYLGACSNPIWYLWETVPYFTDTAASYMIQDENGTRKFGMISKSGRLLTRAGFDRIGTWNNGHAIVKKEGRFGIVNTQGRYTASRKFYIIGDEENYTGPYDSIGEIPDQGNVIPYTTDIWHFGLMTLDGKGIPGSGRRFVETISTTDDYFSYRTVNGWGIMNAAGKTIAGGCSREFEYFDDAQFAVGYKQGKQNIFSRIINMKTGKQFYVNYVDIENIDNNRMIAKDAAGYYHVLDLNGKKIV